MERIAVFLDLENPWIWKFTVNPERTQWNGIHFLAVHSYAEYHPLSLVGSVFSSLNCQTKSPRGISIESPNPFRAFFAECIADTIQRSAHFCLGLLWDINDQPWFWSSSCEYSAFYWVLERNAYFLHHRIDYFVAFLDQFMWIFQLILLQWHQKWRKGKTDKRAVQSNSNTFLFGLHIQSFLFLIILFAFSF